MSDTQIQADHNTIISRLKARRARSVAEQIGLILDQP